jgi:FG-GAP repeat
MKRLTRTSVSTSMMLFVATSAFVFTVMSLTAVSASTSVPLTGFAQVSPFPTSSSTIPTSASPSSSLLLSRDNVFAISGDPSARVSSHLEAGSVQILARNVDSQSQSSPSSSTWSNAASINSATPNTLTAPTPQTGAAYGASVALSDDSALLSVGAPNTSSSVALRSGTAYLYGHTYSDTSRTVISSAWSQSVRVTAPTPSYDAAFGAQVAILSNDTLVVAAPGAHSSSALHVGAVHVYSVNASDPVASKWKITHKRKLQPTSLNGNADFGSSLASVVTEHGHKLFVVGAPNQDSSTALGVGSVYVYKYNRVSGQYDQLQRLTAPSALHQTRPKFGSSVAISAISRSPGATDFNATILVGAEECDSSQALDTGCAFFFVYNPDTMQFTLGQTAQPSSSSSSSSPSMQGNFGAAVALTASSASNSDANGNQSVIAAIGAPTSDSSAALNTGSIQLYQVVFDSSSVSTVVLPSFGLIQSSPNSGDEFGSSVEAQGSSIITSIPGIDTSTTLDQGGLGFYTLCSAGEYCPSGSTSVSDCPQGYYCPTTSTRIACPIGTYNSLTRKTSADACKACPANTFAGSTGTASCMNCSAGTYSCNSGTACCPCLLDRCCNPGFAPQPCTKPSIPLSGVAQLSPYPASSSSSVTTTASPGSPVLLSRDTMFAVSGDPSATVNSNLEAGSVLVLARNDTAAGTSWFNATAVNSVTPATLTAPVPEDGAAFGASVALSDDNSLLGVGAPNASSTAHLQAGSVYLYGHTYADTARTMISRAWSQSVKITSPSTSEEAMFGAQVALLSDDTLVVAAPGADSSSALKTGAVHIFSVNATDLAASNWNITHQRTLQPTSLSSEAAFGSSLDSVVTSHGHKMFVVGAPNQDSAQGLGVGYAYVYKYNAVSHHYEQMQRLTVPSSAATSEPKFGSSVAISAVSHSTASNDFNATILVGAEECDSSDTLDAGCAFFFVFRQSTMQFELSRTAVPSSSSTQGNFGAAVSLSAPTAGNSYSTGNRSVLAAIGAPSADSAAALDTGSIELYQVVFDSASVDTVTLTSFGLIQPSPGSDDEFGTSVSVQGNNIITSVPGLDSSDTLDHGGLALYSHCNVLGDYCPSGATSVQDCAAGYYCPTTNSRVACGNGTYNSLTRQYSADVCTACPPNTFADSPGTAVCKQCGPGTYSCNAGTACCVCEPGFCCTPGAEPKPCLTSSIALTGVAQISPYPTSTSTVPTSASMESSAVFSLDTVFVVSTNPSATVGAALKAGSVLILSRNNSAVNAGWFNATAVNSTIASTLTAPVPQAGAGFGASVALSDDNSLLGIGAPNTSSSTHLRAGAVYLHGHTYTDTSRRGISRAWSQSAKITSPASATDAGFGTHIAMLSDDTLIVTAPTSHSSTALRIGAVHVFSVNASDAHATNWNITHQRKLQPTGLNTNTNFGASLDSVVTAYGHRMFVVGAPNENTAQSLGVGAAYVYAYNPVSQQYDQAQRLTVPASIARMRPKFGSSVAISAIAHSSGNNNFNATILVGAEECDSSQKLDTGCAFLFVYRQSTMQFELSKTIEPSASSTQGNFGASVSLSASSPSTSDSNGFQSVLATIGAPSAESATALDSGSAELYAVAYDGITTATVALSAFGLADPSSRSGDEFGVAVDVQGNNILSCVPGIDSATTLDQGGLAFYKHCDALGDYCPSGSTSVQDCAQGYYCPSTSSRVACARGTYNALTRQSSVDACIVCPAGTFNNVEGAGTLSECQTCPDGEISPPNSTSCSVCAESSYASSNHTVCLPCEAGGYCTGGIRIPCPNGTASTATNQNTNVCQACPAGSIANTTGTITCATCAEATYASDDADKCHNCEAGAHCSGGIKTLCANGTYNPLNLQTSVTACLACPAHTFAGSAGLPACANCSAGTYSCNSSIACCACEPGFWCVPGFAPRACPAGTFNGIEGASMFQQCQTCPDGEISPPNATSCSVCPERSYASSNHTVCLPCEAGGYCTGGIKIPCPNGTANANPNQNAPGACQECPTGSIANTTGTITCTPCAETTYANDDHDRCYYCEQGAYCTGGIKTLCSAGSASSATRQSDPNTCQACTGGDAALSDGSLTCNVCAQGKYANSNHDMCVNCPTGAYCSGGLKQLCAIGTSNNSPMRSTECGPCATGKYTSTPGEDTCEVCQAGKFANSTKSGCEVCPPGFTCADGLKSPCGTGTFNPFPSQTDGACQNCGAGTIANISGSETCTRCHEGSYTIDGQSCVECDCGEFCTNGERTRCSPGKFKTETSSSDACGSCPSGQVAPRPGSCGCTVCPVGMYTDDQISCHDCPGGAFCVGGKKTSCDGGSAHDLRNQTSKSACVQCDPGHVALSGASTCEICNEGHYADDAQLTCLDCPAGAYCTLGIRHNCTAGSANPFPLQSSWTLCFDCTAGKAAQTSGVAECVTCGEGTYANAPKGSSSCLDCPAGAYCSEGLRTNCTAGTANPNENESTPAACVACEPGYIAPVDSLSQCTVCAEGQYDTDNTSLSCTLCPYGEWCSGGLSIECGDAYYTSVLGAVNSSSCQTCEPGLLVSDSKSNCSATCEAGSFVGMSGVSCQTCTLGYWCADGIRNACPPGTSSNIPHNPSISNCKQCDPGEIASLPASTTCTPCGAGSLPDTNRSTCISCPAGSWCDQGIAEKCPAGAFSRTINATSSSTCQTCALGEISVSPGSRNCTVCPPGTYSVGGTRCETCPIGAWCANGNLTTCAAGTYNPSTSQSTEQACQACATTGAFCPPGSSGEELCPAGWYCPDATQAINCTLGQFCPPGRTEHTLCDAGSYCPTTIESLPCEQRDYCPPGTTTRVGKLCPIGHRCPTPAEKIACNNFNGDYCPPGSLVPERCDEGFFCSNSSSREPCHNNSFCTVGSHQPQPCTVCASSQFQVTPCQRTVDRTCQNCDSSCVTCNAGTLGDCTSCPSLEKVFGVTAERTFGRCVDATLPAVVTFNPGQNDSIIPSTVWDGDAATTSLSVTFNRRLYRKPLSAIRINIYRKRPGISGRYDHVLRNYDLSDQFEEYVRNQVEPDDEAPSVLTIDLREQNDKNGAQTRPARRYITSQFNSHFVISVPGNALVDQYANAFSGFADLQTPGARWEFLTERVPENNQAAPDTGVDAEFRGCFVVQDTFKLAVVVQGELQKGLPDEFATAVGAEADLFAISVPNVGEITSIQDATARGVQCDSSLSGKSWFFNFIVTIKPRANDQEKYRSPADLRRDLFEMVQITTSPLYDGALMKRMSMGVELKTSTEEISAGEAIGITAIAAAVVFIFFPLLIYAVNKCRKVPPHKATVVPWMVMLWSIIDFLTDMNFLLTTVWSDPALRWAVFVSIVSLGMLATVNIRNTFALVKEYYYRNQGFFRNSVNLTVSSLVLLLCSINVGSFGILTSNAFGAACFDMPLRPQNENLNSRGAAAPQESAEDGKTSSETGSTEVRQSHRRSMTSLQRVSDRRSRQQMEKRLRNFGWATLILEDGAQLCLQVVVGFTRSGGWDSATLISVCVSAVALVFAVFFLRIIVPALKDLDADHDGSALELRQLGSVRTGADADADADGDDDADVKAVDLQESASVQSGISVSGSTDARTLMPSAPNASGETVRPSSSNEHFRGRGEQSRQ